MIQIIRRTNLVTARCSSRGEFRKRSSRRRRRQLVTDQHMASCFCDLIFAEIMAVDGVTILVHRPSELERPKP
eukprot:1873587-Pleurochrysis_carterae.AAC.1